ncbi:hypothetical protein J4P02_21665 [Pseudomonas sp. NFXW11]|uniref:hypothetical protein n=1 Tax=Pseudomonas sp. NFXW11 TaxID=2819531 RepID=UPI003CEC9B71
MNDNITDDTVLKSCYSSPLMNPELHRVEQYLPGLASYIETVLGDIPSFSAWEQTSSLPYYLNNTYCLLQMTLLGQTCLVLMENPQRSVSLPDVKKHMDTLRKLTQMPMLFVTATLASYERKRLIEKGIQFIVPGNQLFIPELGLDLREYFRARQETVEFISPATQAMLIHLLMNDWKHSLQLSQATLGQHFTYSKMTISRAVKELKGLGLIALGADRQQQIEIRTSARQLWQNARKHMRSPLKKSLWLNAVPLLDGNPLLLAGESALAQQTLLSEPRLPVYACSSETLSALLLQASDFLSEVAAEDAACELQIWTYDPCVYASVVPYVDPFSLILSLQDSKDERIQIGLSQLEGDLKW